MVNKVHRFFNCCQKLSWGIIIIINLDKSDTGNSNVLEKIKCTKIRFQPSSAPFCTSCSSSCQSGTWLHLSSMLTHCPSSQVNLHSWLQPVSFSFNVYASPLWHETESSEIVQAHRRSWWSKMQQICQTWRQLASSCVVEDYLCGEETEQENVVWIMGKLLQSVYSHRPFTYQGTFAETPQLEKRLDWILAKTRTTNKQRPRTKKATMQSKV